MQTMMYPATFAGRSSAIRFGNQSSTSPDRESMRLVQEHVQALSRKLDQVRVTDVREVKPSKWEHEIGYHGDYNQTFQFKLGEDTYRLSKFGQKGYPSSMSYDLDRLEEQRDSRPRHLETLDLHHGFTVLRNGQGQFMVTVNDNQGGWNGEKGTELVAEKRPILRSANDLMKKIEIALGNPFSE